MTLHRSDTRPAPRKSPKQARSLETVKAIVEAAARILEERGHGGFSTNAVADRAGVSVGSLYQYFSGKDALVGALVRRETSVLVEELEAASWHPAGEAALSGFVGACISHQFRRPKLARLLDLEEARLPFDVDTRRVERRTWEVAMRVLAKPGIPAQPDGDVAARDVVAIIKGLVDAAGQRGGPENGTLAGRVRRATFGYLGQEEGR